MALIEDAMLSLSRSLTSSFADRSPSANRRITARTAAGSPPKGRTMLRVIRRVIATPATSPMHASTAIQKRDVAYARSPFSILCPVN